MVISAGKGIAMTTERVYLAGFGVVPLSAISKIRDSMAAIASQRAMSEFDEAKWLVEECGFRL